MIYVLHINIRGDFMSNENESKSIVTSYRLKEDTKADIKRQLDEMGLTQEQYFNKVVTMMELENVKKNNIFAVNTEELDELTKRIYNIFINVCEQGNTFLNTKDSELEELRNKYKDMLVNKDNKIAELKQELQNISINIDNIKKEHDYSKLELADNKLKHEKQLEQLESNLKDKTLIVEEYKEKNDMLLNDLKEYKKYKEENKVLEEHLKQFQKDNNSLLTNINYLENTMEKQQNKIANDTEMIAFYKAEIENKNKSIESYKDDIKVLEIKKDKEIDNIKIDHKKAIEDQLRDITERFENKYKLDIANKDSEIEKLKREVEKSKPKKIKLRKNN
jgi:chromosome segregation ATPase